MSINISDFFKEIGAKRLSEVEVKEDKSNQHELNGINDFREIFGTEKVISNANFIYISDDEDDILSNKVEITWYDARLNHPHRTEYRLYYQTNDVMSNAQPNDLCIIGKLKNDTFLIIVCKEGSTAEKQLTWLFGLEEVRQIVVKDLSKENNELGFASKYILSIIGLDPIEESSDYLKVLLKKFGSQFPSTFEFSEFARSTMEDFSIDENPDKLLLACLEREEMLFRTLERHIVESKLKEGFGKSGADVDEFVQFSLSVQNRRKSRAGLGFENQLAHIFRLHNIQFTKKGKTENNYEPDFLFPGIEKYKDDTFKAEQLTMLGLKTSAKERWRQILPEANRIWPKHLITLEPSISKNQTDQMKVENLQLVIPSGIFPTYTKEQQRDLMNVSEFMKLVSSKQNG